MASGQDIIDLCKRHLLETLAGLPECAPDGGGLGNKAIEEAAGFELGLARADGWFTWSLLMALSVDGRVEVLQVGKRNKKYRLTTP